MTEQIFNLFYIIEDGIIRGRAVAMHRLGGTDEQKLSYLQSRCRDDAKTAKRYPVPDKWLVVDSHGDDSPGLSWESYQTTIAPMHGDCRWFEDIFQAMDAPQEPLVVITCIVDGEVKIEGETAVRLGYEVESRLGNT